MGRAPCCDKANVKKGPWSPEEDAKLKEYMDKNGTGGNWISLPQKAGLRRCGKSCRLRWLNYLRPNIKHGEFSDDEDRIICSLFASIGSRWSIIAAQLPGRTDNDIKNYWNTKLKKKLLRMAQSTQHHKIPHPLSSSIHDSLVQSSSMTAPYSSLHAQISSANEFGNYNYSTPIVSFSRSYDPVTPSFTTQITPNLTVPSELQVQDDNYEQVVKDSNNSNLLVFRGETSCSSSDGSCITTANQMNHGKELEHDYGFSSTCENLGLQNYFSNGVDEYQKFLMSTTSADGAVNGCLSENPLDFGIEEIKQLIGTNSIYHDNLNFFVDEIKTEDKPICTTDI